MSEFYPRAAVGHMPFPGHRTQLTIRLQQEAARRRERAIKMREQQRVKEAIKYGFDPSSLKGAAG